MPGLLVDTNVWLALTFSTHPHQAAALEFLSGTTSTRPALFCRATQQSYLRLLSTPAITEAFGVPSCSNRKAIGALARLASLPSVAYQPEPEHIESIWFTLSDRPSSSPKLWMDAYLAAFAIALDAPFVTFDRGFAHFRGLDLHLLPAD